MLLSSVIIIDAGIYDLLIKIIIQAGIYDRNLQLYLDGEIDLLAMLNEDFVVKYPD